MTESEGYVTGLQYARGLLRHEQERLCKEKTKAKTACEVEAIDEQLATLERLCLYLNCSILAETGDSDDV